MEKLLCTSLLLLFSALLPIPAFPPAAQETRTLVVNGQPSQVSVIQLNGRFYSDLEALSQAVNASLTFKGNQILLNAAGHTESSPATASSTASDQSSTLSRNFLRAAIEAMSSMREWHAALATAIQNQYPIAEGWLANSRNQASVSLRLASTSASNDADRHAVQLLNNVFNNMKRLSDQYVAQAQSHTYIPPDSLANDPLDQRIVNCGHSLAAMAASGQFQDDGSCQ
jgi:hypothetical protein